MKHNPYIVHAYTPEMLAAEINRFGANADTAGMQPAKTPTLLLRLERIPAEAVAVLQRELSAVREEAVLFQRTSRTHSGESDVIMSGNLGQLQNVFVRLREKGELEDVCAETEEFFRIRERWSKRKELVCGSHVLPLRERTLVMGIVNVTPDSFSDGGRYLDVDRAVNHAMQLVEAGADIIDVGGESTRPGFEPVDLSEELNRVLPVVEALANVCPVPISIDTYKAEVADRAIRAGAHIINDVWGARRDERMAEVAAALRVPIILMHNRPDMDYVDFFSDLIRDLRQSVSIAAKAGVEEEKIILDPGIGFAKTLEQNLEAMQRLDDLCALGYPVLLGTSRKSMIGRVLDLPVDERLEGTIATVALGVAKGCRIVRVHDVKEVKRAVRMMDAMLGGGFTVGQTVL